MKGEFDVAQDVRSLINIEAVTSLITGKIYPFVRPDNSTKTDIVIRPINCNNRQIQEADVNIKIHAASVTAPGATQVDYFPDYTDLITIVNIILPLVNDQYRDGFDTEIDFTDGPIEDRDGSFFYLIRVIYRHFQNNYNNI